MSTPDTSWVTDITYIRTWQGWLYLAVVLDLYSRKVIGWSMKPTLAKDIVLDALLMAVWRRRPNEPVIIHSDQGSQYSSGDWQKFCQKHNLIPSMSRRGNCWDNAVAESFFSSLKKERIKKRIYKTREWRVQMCLITSRCLGCVQKADIVSMICILHEIMNRLSKNDYMFLAFWVFSLLST